MPPLGVNIQVKPGGDIYDESPARTPLKHPPLTQEEADERVLANWLRFDESEYYRQIAIRGVIAFALFLLVLTVFYVLRCV